jgi:hypothetical protein
LLGTQAGPRAYVVLLSNLARPGVNPVTGVFPRQQPAERPCQSQEERRIFRSARATLPIEDEVIEQQKLEREKGISGCQKL